MEQITLDMLDEMSAETAAYKLIEPALLETMRNATTPADMLIFKADGAQYSSLYLGSENSLVCRISIRGKKSYVTIPRMSARLTSSLIRIMCVCLLRMLSRLSATRRCSPQSSTI